MINSKRRPVNKHRSAKKFRHDAHHAHVKNVQHNPMRGGWRL